MANAKLNQDQIDRVKSMWTQGYTRQSIADMFNVSVATIDRYKSEAIDNYHKGGFLSNSIPITSIEGKPVELPEKEESKKEVEKETHTILVDQTMIVAGRKTAVTYTLNSKQSIVKCEGEFLCADIKIDDLPDLAQELMEVYRLATKMRIQ